MLTDTLIIGGGLSGLALAAKLAAQGRDFLLGEARDRYIVAGDQVVYWREYVNPLPIIEAFGLDFKNGAAA